MDFQLIIQRIAAYALPLLFALTVREMVRGHVAYRLGDLTAHQQGRLSLNPLAYVDPLGTLILPMAMLVLSAAGGFAGFLIGWPKLVPINAGRLHKPRRDVALIAVSGLAANLVMALIWGVLLRVTLGQDTGEGLWAGIKAMSVAGVMINLSFFALNLLPLLPFDMAQLLVALLPPKRSEIILKLEPYSLVIFLLLAITGILRLILTPILIVLLLLVLRVVGVPFDAMGP